MYVVPGSIPGRRKTDLILTLSSSFSSFHSLSLSFYSLTSIVVIVVDVVVVVHGVVLSPASLLLL